MIATSQREGRWKRRLMFSIGAFFVFLSLFSVLVSVAMPGVGWILSAAVLILARLMVPITGKRCVVLSLGISLVHLLTFGPLAGFRVQPGVEAWFFVLTIVVPMLAGISVLFVPANRGR